MRRIKGAKHSSPCKKVKIPTEHFFNKISGKYLKKNDKQKKIKFNIFLLFYHAGNIFLNNHQNDIHDEFFLTNYEKIPNYEMQGIFSFKEKIINYGNNFKKKSYTLPFF